MINMKILDNKIKQIIDKHDLNEHTKLDLKNNLHDMINDIFEDITDKIFNDILNKLRNILKIKRT